MQSYKLKVILGFCLAQRIVSKLSKKKKKNHNYPPHRAFLLSLNSVQFQEHCFLIYCFQLNFFSDAFLNRVLYAHYRQPLLRLGSHYFSLHDACHKVKNKGVLLILPLQIRRKGDSKWLLGPKNSGKATKNQNNTNARFQLLRSSHT